MQTHARKPAATQREATVSTVPGADHKTREQLNAEMDAVLDEIDEALEGTELIAANYIQKNGE